MERNNMARAPDLRAAPCVLLSFPDGFRNTWANFVNLLDGFRDLECTMQACMMCGSVSASRSDSSGRFSLFWAL